MFETLKPLPQDPILQLMQTFRDDPRPDKVDLGIGVYKDDAGNTPSWPRSTKPNDDCWQARPPRATSGQLAPPATTTPWPASSWGQITP